MTNLIAPQVSFKKNIFMTTKPRVFRRTLPSHNEYKLAKKNPLESFLAKTDALKYNQIRVKSLRGRGASAPSLDPPRLAQNYVICVARHLRGMFKLLGSL